MRTLLTFTTSLVVALSAGTMTYAGGGKGGNSPSSHTSLTVHQPQSIHYSKSTSYTKTSTYQNYHLTNGKKFSKGFYYPGKFHNHWSYCFFSKKCGCYCYWCPCTTCWYYYCVPDCCYYPICYVPYSCYCWGAPVAYCSAPVPPSGIQLPEPASIGPDAP